MRKEEKKKRDIVSIVLVAAILIIAAAVGITFINELRFSGEVKAENEEIRELYVSGEEKEAAVDFSSLCEANPDVCAWIKVDNTNIDLPVVQGSNNLEYLNKNVLRESALYGAVFADVRNSADFSDSYTLLYGHHMDDGNMFGDIDLFEDEGFFDANGSGTLYTKEATFRLSAVAFITADAKDEYLFTPEQWTEENLPELIKYAELAAENKKEFSGKKYIALSTCSAKGENLRSILLMALEE